MNHIVLLGDSIFDNAAYVDDGRGEKPVLDQLRGLLPDGWKVTLKAVDGHFIGDVCRQLDEAPADASHLVVSAGGNDALIQRSTLWESADSVGEALLILAGKREKFRGDYRAMLHTVCARGKATVVCAIYDRFSLAPGRSDSDEDNAARSPPGVQRRDHR